MPTEVWTILQSDFITDALNFSIYVAMAVLFIVCMIKCVLPVMNTKRLLNKAVRSIRKNESGKRSWQNEKFLGNGTLFPHWSEYLNNLFFADGEFHNPSSVEDYINEDTVVYSPGRATLGEAMPGLMVSLGFLGTLVGISTGLKGFSMENTEAVMAAIRQLVPGMQYAFTTSIVGVIASIGCTLLIRMVNGAAFRSLNSFYHAMNKYAGVQSVDPMTQIAIYQQEQTNLIHAMAEDITGAMTDRLATAIEKSLQPLKRSMDEFVNVSSREQTRGVDMMVQRFVQSMNESVNHQFAQLAQTIENTNRNTTLMQDGIKRAVDGLTGMSHDLVQVQQISDSLLNKFDSYMTKINSSYRTVDEGYERIGAIAERLDMVSRQQNSYIQSMTALQNEIVRAGSSVQNATETFLDTFGEEIRGMRSSMNLVSTEMKKSGDTLADTHGKLIDGINKDMDRTYTKFFDNTNDAFNQLSWMVSDVKNNIAKLPELLDRTENLYAGQADRLSEALRQLQSALDGAVDGLKR